MKTAIVTLRKTFKINKNEKQEDLKKVYNMFSFWVENTQIQSTADWEARKADLISTFKQDAAPFFKRYLKFMNETGISYQNLFITDLYFDKRKPAEDYYMDITALSDTYTLLDSLGDQLLLLAHGDLREILKTSEPKIGHAFFYKINSNIAFDTYIPIK